ncbi:MAG: drug resistance transporter, EmrB/QacA subfamily [Caulobacter sp.]|nr:drug resistance transporter, EmrB/QacA subfamily [Caulobacter sp.]
MTLSGNGKGDDANRLAITSVVMLATFMAALDGTIANVALPHIQGSVQASADQITWVLTSYIVAAAIMTPLTGFLADKLGRKVVFMVSILGFTVASVLCGIATSLVEIVAFRLLQGLFGAALIPLSQAILLDINPPEKHGQAMAIWSAGAVVGPIIGPVLGGWLTENLSWRWVFLINLPVGLLTAFGLFLFLSEKRAAEQRKFDFLGYASLIAGIGGIQMMLDRGPGQDWFKSMEIWTYLIIGVIGLWVFVVQIATAKRPFVNKGLLADVNFSTACLFGFFTGVLLFSSLALLPSMMQNLMGYPVAFSGWVSMPRGIGSFITMFAVGQLITRINVKVILSLGLFSSGFSLWLMTHFSLNMDTHLLILSGFFQGVSMGLVFVPLSIIAFSTINPKYRTEGAGLFTLIRNIGSSVGISVMQARLVSGLEAHRTALAAHARPDNPIYQAYLTGPFSLDMPAGLAAFGAMVNRQASMLAYIDDFQLMLIMTLLCCPLILLMRTPKRVAKDDTIHAAVD